MGTVKTSVSAVKTLELGWSERAALQQPREYGKIEPFLGRARMDHRELLKGLLRRKSLVRGEFTLSSGLKSNYYLDCKLTTLDPEGSVLVGYSILELLEREGIQADAIGGPTIGADPIVTAVAAVSYLEKKRLPAFLVRKERKEHGRERQIEGLDLKEGSKVVIVDEVCTTGKSTLDALTAVEGAGLRVLAVVSLVDREEGGSERLRKTYQYYPVFTAKELLEDSSQDEREHSEAAEDSCRSVGADGRTT
ncbi:MAG: orotate phosphoribosyltransferase [Terriglobia bacterium]